jgi:catechol 2,3-dioxygenase-like lactoylglutathione lyase family enzyme
MPPITHLLETSLYVDDVDRSVEFYQKVFGFSVISRSERLHAMSVADGQVLLLFKKRLSADLSTTPHDGDGQLHLAFGIERDQLAVWDSWLNALGIVIEEKKQWDLGGVSLYFRDPDGHLVEVATPGVWSNY